MIGAGTYLLGIALLAALAASLALSAVRLRRRLLPSWRGAPAHLVDAVTAVALLVWLAELLGLVGLLRGWLLVAAALALAGALALPGSPEEPGAGEGKGTPPPPGPSAPRGGGGEGLLGLAAIGAVAVVFAHWGLTAHDALNRGIFNFDSLWYHMPFAVEIAHGHSVTALHHPETVLTSWFYPQNSELLHAVGILLTQRDTLSLFLNFGWLALAFLAAWCAGRPHGRGALAVVSAAVVLECHTLVVREPGAAKNDLVAAALLLAAVAILLNAASAARGEGRGGAAARALEPGWAVAAAGLAVGLAAGTKLTALAIAAALTVAVVALAPGRRAAAAAWWLLPALAAGGYWYLRNLVAAGNPLPQVERLGPLSLSHPETLQSGRPDRTVADYATDTAVWREYFGPGLEQAFGVLWPLVVGGAIAGAALALARGGNRAVHWSGAAALLGLLAYAFTPLSASGAAGEPVGFAINIRFAIPPLLLGAALLPLGLLGPAREAEGGARGRRRRRLPGRAEAALLAALLLVMAVTNRADAVLRDPDRVFAIPFAVLVVLVPAALALARRRGARRGAIAGLALLAALVAALGYPLQRGYLEDRFGPGSRIPGMSLNSAYHWAREVSGARIGLAGTTAGFLGYGFYGTDLGNEVRYLGEEGPRGAFNAIPTCSRFRAAVNDAGLDYLVTAPFLNFIDPRRPIRSPEAGWLRGEPAARPLRRSGPVTVWRLAGPLDPGACGPRNAPLRHVPQQPPG